MNAIAFDHCELAVHMIQRVTHSRPAVTITAPVPEQLGSPYDVVSEANREAYIAQSARTHGGVVAEFVRDTTLPVTQPADAGKDSSK